MLTTSVLAMILLPVALMLLYPATTQSRQVSSVSGSNPDSDTLVQQHSQQQDRHQQALPLYKRSVDVGMDDMSFADKMKFFSLMRAGRNFEPSVRAPPRLSHFPGNNLMPALKKRDDEWIWMPAHGYIPMPRDDNPNAQEDQDSGIGNLLRYG